MRIKKSRIRKYIAIGTALLAIAGCDKYESYPKSRFAKGYDVVIENHNKHFRPNPGGLHLLVGRHQDLVLNYFFGKSKLGFGYFDPAIYASIRKGSGSEHTECFGITIDDEGRKSGCMINDTNSIIEYIGMVNVPRGSDLEKLASKEEILRIIRDVRRDNPENR